MKKQTYTDLNLDFKQNPFTGDVIKSVNIDAIKKSFRNLILTNFYEVPFNPSIGSNIRGSLFENFTPLNIEFTKSKIRELISEREPRVNITTINILQQPDYNNLQVSIEYVILELNRNDTITLMIGRTR